MVVQDYELNLSLQEYLLYQECPAKFRIYRMLNPLPNKPAFLNAPKRSLDEYIARGYKKQELDGIKFHLFASTFHQFYGRSIQQNIQPGEFLENRFHSYFWKYQRQRYLECDGKYPWMPFQIEFSAMTEKQRGIIDCIEFCNNDEELLIIDYKKNEHETDIESLYFYVILLENFLFEMNWEGLRIKEIGNYYYFTGKLETQKINSNKKEKIKRKICTIQEKIKNLELHGIEGSCAACNFKIICKIEGIRKK
ncbi:MAG: PD-(D/E)XK nuclease family protein [Candidatus Heimdallarchaeota archaeon]